MCGLFGGLSNTLSAVEKERIKELGIVSSLRGIDSTGLIALKKEKKNKIKFQIRKAVANPVTFLNSKEAASVVNEGNCFAIIGHARAATIGAVNQVNAHPIQEGKIVGCHNGSINALAPTKDKEQETSDSRNLFKAINEIGIIPALRRAKTGFYALSYIDTKTRKLYFVRNSHRPLFLMYQQGRGTLYWASEYRFLDMMSMGHAANFEQPVLIPDDTLISIDLTNMGWPIRETRQDISNDLKDKPVFYNTYPKKEEVKKETSVPLLPAPGMGKSSASSASEPSSSASAKRGQSIFCTNCKFRSDYCNCPGGHTMLFPHEWQISEDGLKYSDDDKRVDPIVLKAIEEAVAMAKKPEVKAHYTGFKNEIMSCAEGNERLKKGCANCKCKHGISDQVHWVSAHNYYCMQCFGLPTVVYALKGMSTYIGKIVRQHG